MGFNKKYISKNNSLDALKRNSLTQLYSSDALFFEDSFSYEIFKLHKDGRCDTYIINKLKIKF